MVVSVVVEVSVVVGIISALLDISSVEVTAAVAVVVRDPLAGARVIPVGW